MRTLSSLAINALFSQESQSDLITTITIFDPENDQSVVARIADGRTARLRETDQEIIFGVLRHVGELTRNSTTGIQAGTGSKTFGLLLNVYTPDLSSYMNRPVFIYSKSDPSITMYGKLTGWSYYTYTMTINVTQVTGAGTYKTDWVIYIGDTQAEFLYLPVEIGLPTEEEGNPPRATLTMYDATSIILPVLKEINGQPKIQIDLVLSNSPNVVEVTYSDLFLSSITYTAGEVKAELAAVNYAVEPFPTHRFTPAYFPGLF